MSTLNWKWAMIFFIQVLLSEPTIFIFLSFICLGTMNIEHRKRSASVGKFRTRLLRKTSVCSLYQTIIIKDAKNSENLPNKQTSFLFFFSWIYHWHFFFWKKRKPFILRVSKLLTRWQESIYCICTVLMLPYV